jgi:hypothetical protein
MPLHEKGKTKNKVSRLGKSKPSPNQFVPFFVQVKIAEYVLDGRVFGF